MVMRNATVTSWPTETSRWETEPADATPSPARPGPLAGPRSRPPFVCVLSVRVLTGPPR